MEWNGVEEIVKEKEERRAEVGGNSRSKEKIENRVIEIDK